MKILLEAQLTQALNALIADGEFALAAPPEIALERSRGPEHGDFSCPLALALARELKRNPRQIAQAIVARIPGDAAIERIEIAGPGFINFFLRRGAMSQVLRTVHHQGSAFGCTDSGAGVRIQVEFVSANPTGPLHVGHGRHAAYGAVVANLLEATGHSVEREYYVNDAGRQMDILALSVWLRYLELHDQPVSFPSKGYQGAYVRDMARSLSDAHGSAFVRTSNEVVNGLPPDTKGESRDADAAREAHMDALIARARLLLEQSYKLVFDHALATQVADIRDDLAQFGVHFDRWFSERSLTTDGSVARCLEQLTEAGQIYQQDGTRWFKSSEYGDEKDRVVVRENGVPTYFTSDIAYVRNKFERGFDRIIYVWGADHHGYVPRVMAAARAQDLDASRIEIPLVQFVQLFRGGQKAQMSTRSGEFVTLRDLRVEVGNDAARFFYVMRRVEQHLDFDLDLAKSQRNDNPVHYVHYAHARIVSTQERAKERGMSVDFEQGLESLERLELDHEHALMRAVDSFPEAVAKAAAAREPHQITYYLRELANALHGYYALDGMRLLHEDDALRNARFALCEAVRIVLANGLALLGVSAPRHM